MCSPIYFNGVHLISFSFQMVPGLVTHLIADRVERSILSGDPNYGVCPSLSRGPMYFPDMESAGKASLASNTVCALRHWVSVECQLVIFLRDEKTI
jgi:hypothetical protein